MTLGQYVRMSTANPTGWRPWQSRLQGLGAFYLQNTYPLPTTGRGPFLLQPGVTARPTVTGGLGRLGQTEIFGMEVDPTMLALGLVALLAAIYLLGSGKPKRKARRLRRRISRSQAQLRDLQAV